MSVFISWGEKESLSHEGALLLQEWLPEVLPKLESFVSSENLESGSLWLEQLFEHLEKSESGILCLTKETLDRSWILFEAGALAKRAGDQRRRVCPLLFEFETLKFPLLAFQAHSLDKNDETKSKKEMLLLVKTLNKNREEVIRLDENQIERQFERCWQKEFWEKYVKLCEKHAVAKKPHAPAKVSNEEILSEMRGAFRQFGEVLSEIRRNSTVLPVIEQPSQIQQLIVKCPYCNFGNGFETLNKIGTEMLVICKNCGNVFNAQLISPQLVQARKLRDGNVKNFMASQDDQEGVSAASVAVLKATQAWIPSEALEFLFSTMVRGHRELKQNGQEVSANKLQNFIYNETQRANTAISNGIVRQFVKLVFHGRVFKFADGIQPSFKSPYCNEIDERSLQVAFADECMSRLLNSLPINVENSSAIAHVLFGATSPEKENLVKQIILERSAQRAKIQYEMGGETTSEKKEKERLT